MNILTAVVLLFALFVGFGRVGDDWEVGLVSDRSAAAQADIEVGDRIVAIDGVTTASWDELTGLIEQRAGETVDITVERDGEIVESTTVIGERLSDEGAEGFEGLIGGDIVLAFAGRPVADHAEFAALAADRIGEEVEVTVRRGAAEGVVRARVRSVDAADPTDGFLGVARQSISEPDDPLTATWQSVRATGEISKAFVVGTGRFFTPQRIGSFFEQVADNASGGGADDGARPLESGPALEDGGSARDDENRVVSIIGVVDFGRQISEDGPAAFIAFLASISIMFGILNLIPLLPFDGGHITVAVYERLRERNGQRYFVDITKLMPVMYAVILVFAVLGLAAAYLDVVDGIQV